MYLNLKSRQFFMCMLEQIETHSNACLAREASCTLCSSKSRTKHKTNEINGQTRKAYTVQLLFRFARLLYFYYFYLCSVTSASFFYILLNSLLQLQCHHLFCQKIENHKYAAAYENIFIIMIRIQSNQTADDADTDSISLYFFNLVILCCMTKDVHIFT